MKMLKAVLNVLVWVYVVTCDPDIWRSRLRIWRMRYWQLIGRCVLCGAMKEPVKLNVYRMKYPQLCHCCGKTMGFGTVYGAGPKRIASMVQKRTPHATNEVVAGHETRTDS